MRWVMWWAMQWATLYKHANRQMGVAFAASGLQLREVANCLSSGTRGQHVNALSHRTTRHGTLLSYFSDSAFPGAGEGTR